MRSETQPARKRARSGSPKELYQTEFDRQIEAWSRSLARTARKPSPGAVHDLRVHTLRLHAGLEYWSAQRHDLPHSRKAGRWIAHARKLRSVLGPVREADVTLKKLKNLREQIAGSSRTDPPGVTACLRQIGKLERKVRRERRGRAKQLVEWLRERGKRMERSALKLKEALSEFNPFPAGCGAAVLAKFLAGQAAEAAKLDNNSLHEFRKQLKKACYLAEISGSGESPAEMLSAPLRKLQSAVGEWHDWDSLARKARHALGSRGKAEPLLSLLEARAARTLSFALRQIRRSLAGLPSHQAARRPLL